MWLYHLCSLSTNRKGVPALPSAKQSESRAPHLAVIPHNKTTSFYKKNIISFSRNFFKYNKNINVLYIYHNLKFISFFDGLDFQLRCTIISEWRPGESVNSNTREESDGPQDRTVNKNSRSSTSRGSLAFANVA